jgi:hypothetical protein
MNTRPDRDGDEQLRLLDAAWEEAARYWRDEVARQFAADHWTPLAQQARAYLEALRGLMDMLETAERETDF